MRKQIGQDTHAFLEERVAFHNKRAVLVGGKGTLRLWQWNATWTYFEGKCAYCLERKASALEHFIPLSRGGDTIWSNVVPACYWCNMEKGDMLPWELRGTILKKDLLRVQQYLISVYQRMHDTTQGKGEEDES